MSRRKPVLAMASVSCIVLASAGCGAGGGDDDYSAAIPTAAMLAMSLDEGTATSALSGTAAEPTIIGDAKTAASGVMALLQETHGDVDALIASAEHRTVTQGGRVCRVWEADGRKAHWKLAACLQDRVARRYSYALFGQPLGSTSETSYKAVLGGAGVALPRYEGRRRGAGTIVYDLDNLEALTGDGFGGKVGVGYRLAGRARQVVVGLDVAHGPAHAPLSAFFRYTHVIGVGGRFVFLTSGDYLATGAGGEVVQGQDGQVEDVRAALAWATDGRARAVATACGGTLGPGRCDTYVQCYAADSSVTFWTLGDVTWDQSKCGEVAMTPAAPPAEADVTPPDSATDANGIFAPGAAEPPAIPGE